MKNDKIIDINELSRQNEQLQNALAEMCANADEDCPSEYRTEHFRLAMKDAYTLLEKLNYFKNE
jgi:hypothetical protein